MAERLCAIQAVLGSIPGGDQIFLILYCLKSLWKRENTFIDNVFNIWKSDNVNLKINFYFYFVLLKNINFILTINFNR